MDKYRGILKRARIIHAPVILQYLLRLEIMTSNGQATPFPRTPYPFDVVNPSQHTLPPISEWLEVQNEDEYHPEELALSPEEAVRNSDMTWPFGTPDWIAESAFTELPEPALCAECRASGTAASDGSYEVVDDCSSETSSLDVTSQIDHLPSSPTIPNDQQLLHNTASEGEPKMLAAAKGKTRPRSTEIDPVDQPANKRPRLDRKSLSTHAGEYTNQFKSTPRLQTTQTHRAPLILGRRLFRRSVTSHIYLPRDREETASCTRCRGVTLGCMRLACLMSR